MASMRKRKDGSFDRYFNVCLILNENTKSQLCTNTPYGYNNDFDPFITWFKPTNNVETVELVFRDNKHAQIADLKIFYQPE